MRFLVAISVAVDELSGVRELLATTLSSELELAPFAAASPPSFSIAQLSGAVHSRSVNCPPSGSGSYGSMMVFGEILWSCRCLRFEETAEGRKGSVNMDIDGEGGVKAGKLGVLESKALEALGRGPSESEMALMLMKSSIWVKSVSIVRRGSSLAGRGGCLLRRCLFRDLSLSLFGRGGRAGRGSGDGPWCKGDMYVPTESWEGFGVNVAKGEMASLIESEEASFERGRFFMMMSLKKLREPLPLRGSAIDMSDTEET